MLIKIHIKPNADSHNSNPLHVDFDVDTYNKKVKLTLDDGRNLTFNLSDLEKIVSIGGIEIMELPISPPDVPEELSSREILDLLLKDLYVKIDNEEFELCEITDKIDIEKLRELVQEAIRDDFDIRCAYCEVIEGLML